jgi:hypothetical protein
MELRTTVQGRLCQGAEARKEQAPRRNDSPADFVMVRIDRTTADHVSVTLRFDYDKGDNAKRARREASAF